MAPNTARQKVLAQLKKQRAPISAAQIARALNMNPASIRHHLGILVADGRARIARYNQTAGRGRPSQLYAPAFALRGENIAAALGAVLDEAPRREELLRAAGARLGGRPEPELPLARRLGAAVERLNEMHYEAHWEAGPEGPRMLFANCPYARIIEKHPELCRLDASMLESRMGASVRQTAKMQPGGPNLCVFNLSNPAQNTKASGPT
jgi:predicted ArsR family transcriptional regulator